MSLSRYMVVSNGPAKTLICYSSHRTREKADAMCARARKRHKGKRIYVRDRWNVL